MGGTRTGGGTTWTSDTSSGASTAHTLKSGSRAVCERHVDRRNHSDERLSSSHRLHVHRRAVRERYRYGRNVPRQQYIERHTKLQHEDEEVEIFDGMSGTPSGTSIYYLVKLYGDDWLGHGARERVAGK